MASLRDLSEEEFVKALERSKPSVAPTQRPDELQRMAPDIAPDTRTALVQASNQLNSRLPADFISQEGKDLGMRPGVDLDIETGAPLNVRTSLGLDRNKLNQFKLLQSIYGPNVDVSAKGRFIIRNQRDANGRASDLMVDPIGFDRGDIDELGAQALPMVAGFVGARLGARPSFSGLGKVVGAVTGMALAQEGTGVIQDAIVRATRGDKVDLSDIAIERGKDAIADEAFGLAAAGVGKVLAKGLATMTGIGAALPESELARRQLSEATGINYPLTPGEKTGSKLLLRMESMSAEQPGSAGVFDKIRATQRKAVDGLRKIFLEIPLDAEEAAVLPNAETTGKAALGRLGSDALQLEGQVATARQNVLRTGTAEAQLAAGANMDNPLSRTAVGQAVRDEVKTQYDAFKSAANDAYEAFLSKPEISEKIIPTDDLARFAKQFKLPSIIKTKEIETGLLNEFGDPLTVTKTVEERLNQFVAPKVRSALDELAGLKGGKTAIADLKQVRTSIDDAIAEGISIPGTDISQLLKIKESVNGAIRNGLQDLPDGKALLAEWDTLNTGYSKGMARFDRASISRMLIKEGEQGAIGNAAIVGKVTGGGDTALDTYNEFKQFFGPTSPQFRTLNQAIREDALSDALSRTTGFVDGKLLISKLDRIPREVAAEVLGVKEPELRRISEALATAQGKFDIGELQQLAGNKTLTAQKLMDLASAEQDKATAYGNKLFAAAAKGNLGQERIQPSEFVRNMTSGKVDPTDIRDVIGRLSDRPELLQQIRQLAIEDFLGQAKFGLQKSGRGATSQGITEAFGDRTQVARWQALLGQDMLETLETAAKTFQTGDFASTTFKGGGRLAGNALLNRIFAKGEVGALPDVASRFVMAFLYSGPARPIVEHLLTPSNAGRFLNGVIASEPFAKGLFERFGPDEATGIMGYLKDIVAPLHQKELLLEGRVKPSETNKIDLRSLSTDEFKRYLNSVKQ